MEQLLEKTMIGSLDCPALEGVRQSADMLDGYRAAGADHWYFLQDDDEDAGCLLLAESSDMVELELVYMGLIPHRRGFGLGNALVQFAQNVARRASRSRLVTAVDVANTPACAAYNSAGFCCWDRRQVLLRVFK